MMTKAKFTLFACYLLVMNSVEVRDNDEVALAPKFRLGADAETLTDTVFNHDGDRVSLNIFEGNSDWNQGGIEIVLDTDIGTGEVLVYIENYTPRIKHMIPANQSDFDRVQNGG